MMHEMRENIDGSLTVQTYDIIRIQGNLKRVVAHEFTSHNEDAVIEYLMDVGVRESETIYALDQMDEQGHNVASFGVRGGFVVSKFEGAIQ
jgi:hypothetical protein